MIRVGDKVSCRMSYRMSNDDDRANEGNDRTTAGTVVWIHPRGRYYVVEFSFPLGNIRECYPFVWK